MTSSSHPSRRVAIGGLAAASLAGRAAAAAANFWNPYEQRLRARIRDAAGGAFDEAMGRALLGETNRFRAGQGRTSLAWDADLAAAARAHAADMADRAFFDHRTTERFDVGDRVAILARTLLGAPGENIAYRFDTRAPPSAAEFQRRWRDSPGHRENMLRPGYTHVGFGVLRRGDRAWAVGVFADVDARLAEPLPWRVADRATLERLLAAASPAIGRYGISEPGVEHTYDIKPLGGRLAPLPTEVSQLRPLIATSARGFEVLWGPIFVV